MKRPRFTDEQIIGELREAGASAMAADLARRHGLSEATLYIWESMYGGLAVSEATWLRALTLEKITILADGYNTARPHSSLNYTPPGAIAANLEMQALLCQYSQWLRSADPCFTRAIALPRREGL
jgi:putative transposase